jgi:hypothetical protein
MESSLTHVLTYRACGSCHRISHWSDIFIVAWNRKYVTEVIVFIFEKNLLRSHEKLIGYNRKVSNSRHVCNRWLTKKVFIHTQHTNTLSLTKLLTLSLYFLLRYAQETRKFKFLHIQYGYMSMSINYIRGEQTVQRREISVLFAC